MDPCPDGRGPDTRRDGGARRVRRRLDGRPPPAAARARPVARARRCGCPTPATPPPAPPSPAGAAIVVTLAGGAVVSLLLHRPTFLILSSIGALGTLATALWPRLRRRARGRSERDRARAAAAAVAAAVETYQAAVAARLRADALELPAAVACRRRAGPALWARRASDPGAFAAVVGRGDRWQPPALASGGDAVPEEWWAVVEAAGALRDVPVTVDLGPGAVVGVVGPPAVARPLLRSLVLQLTVAHGPADLLVAAVTAPGSPELGWLRWLPHARDPDSGDRLVATGGDLPSALPGRGRVSRTGRTPALAAPRARRGRSGAGGAPATPGPASCSPPSGPAPRWWRRTTVASLPSICDVVIEARPGRHRRRPPARSGRARRARDRRRRLRGDGSRRGPRARPLARPRAGRAGAGLPTSVSLDVPAPGRLRHGSRGGAAGLGRPPAPIPRCGRGWRWRRTARSSSTWSATVPTRSSPEPPARARASCCGRSWRGWPSATPPDHLAFVLVDYKGGAAFDACARLPHVAGVVTDLDERLAERALRSLHAELRRREQLLRAAGAADLSAYRARARNDADPAPRRRGRRAGHARAGPAGVRALAGRRGAARSQPRRAPRAGHPAAGRRRQRRRPRQHEPAHRPPGAGRGRLRRRGRRPRCGLAPPSPAGPGGAALRPG